MEVNETRNDSGLILVSTILVSFKQETILLAFQGILHFFWK